MGRRRKTNFVEEEELQAEYQEWLDSAQLDGDRVVPESLANHMYDIAKHLTSHIKFGRYPQHEKDEMIQEAVLKMSRNVHNYRREKGTMFNYLTTVAWSAFVTHLAKYYRDINHRRELILRTLEHTTQREWGSRQYLHQLLEELRADVKEYGGKDNEDE